MEVAHGVLLLTAVAMTVVPVGSARRFRALVQPLRVPLAPRVTDYLYPGYLPVLTFMAGLTLPEHLLNDTLHAARYCLDSTTYLRCLWCWPVTGKVLSIYAAKHFDILV